MYNAVWLVVLLLVHTQGSWYLLFGQTIWKKHRGETNIFNYEANSATTGKGRLLKVVLNYVCLLQISKFKRMKLASNVASDQRWTVIVYRNTAHNYVCIYACVI